MGRNSCQPLSDYYLGYITAMIHMCGLEDTGHELMIQRRTLLRAYQKQNLRFNSIRRIQQKVNEHKEVHSIRYSRPPKIWCYWEGKVVSEDDKQKLENGETTVPKIWFY